MTSAVRPDQYPKPLLPEIAFVGRSNVGKSSLINTLLNRKGLVKTSSTPGKTQTINFFQVNDQRVRQSSRQGSENLAKNDRRLSVKS